MLITNIPKKLTDTPPMNIPQAQRIANESKTDRNLIKKFGPYK